MDECILSSFRKAGSPGPGSPDLGLARWLEYQFWPSTATTHVHLGAMGLGAMTLSSLPQRPHPHNGVAFVPTLLALDTEHGDGHSPAGLRRRGHAVAELSQAPRPG